MNLGKNPEALRAFWITLKINALNSRGKRLTEMPLEWFKIPAEKDLMNPLICSLAVFSENRVMESRDYETAKDLIDWLGYIKTGMVPIYRAMLQCDRIFCELMVNGPTPKVDVLLTPSLDKIMQKMKTYPSVIRTRYALALLKNKDEKEALRIKKRFASASFRHPYPAEFKSEEKLLIDVDRKYRTLLK